MKVQDFIISKIDELADLFSFINFTYEYKDRSGVHFIKITPLEFLTKDPVILNAINGMHLDFIKSFPGTHIAFLADDSLVKITRPAYERKQRFLVAGPILDSLISESWFKGFVPHLPTTDFQFKSNPMPELFFYAPYEAATQGANSFNFSWLQNEGINAIKIEKNKSEKTDVDSIAQAA